VAYALSGIMRSSSRHSAQHTVISIGWLASGQIIPRIT
jgi:hypothetical protein